MKTKPQPEMNWTQPEDFRLVQEQQTDFDRVKSEQAQRDADRKTAESKQIPLFT